MTARRYRIGELAKVAGVTVRTLHHYDELRLLRPSERTGAGHRLYDARDVERLYRLLALRAPSGCRSRRSACCSTARTAWPTRSAITSPGSSVRRRCSMP